MKKKIVLPTAEQLDSRLSAIEPEPMRRGWKSAFLDQHAARLEAALKQHTYDQVAHALHDCGVDIAPATLSNWRKQRRREVSCIGGDSPLMDESTSKPRAPRHRKSTPASPEATGSLFPSDHETVP